jgi:serine/threonine protein kinase
VFGILGAGAFGQVNRVLSLVGVNEYARKRIPRQKLFGNASKVAVESFLDELRILKKLKHRHIVELVGSYTDISYFGLLMTPIGNMDLAIFLGSHPENLTMKRSTLRSFFGCLLVAVQFLHDSGVCHKVIKPQNIIIKGDRVLLTDLGISRESIDTTSGFGPHTPRYCAPEVVPHSCRNWSSDIWSRGCVFLEMASVIKDWSMDDMHSFMSSRGNTQRFVDANAGRAVVFHVNAVRTDGREESMDVVTRVESGAPITVQ